MRCSTLVVPDDAVGDARIYGRFEAQTILGQPCTIIIERLEDADPRAVDLLGVASFRRGGTAIHISGLDPFGDRTGPGFIRALGMYSINWLGRADHPSGFGADEPEPGAILTWDGAHQRDTWRHHAHCGPCTSILTLQSVANLMRGEFNPQDVCALADKIQRRSGCMSYQDHQHIKAVRRMLDTNVDVQNNHLEPRAVLRRVGRWTYQWA